MEPTSSVNFVCQRCQVPIVISDQFDKLNEHVLAELTLPIYSNADNHLDSQTLSFDHYAPPFRLTDSGNGTNGFTLISNASELEGGHGGHGGGTGVDSLKLKVRAELFDKLSNHSDINHPMCTECTDTLIEMVDTKLRLAEEDRVDFERYLDELDACTDTTDVDQLAQELSALNAEEKKLLEELAGLKVQEDSLNASIRSQSAEDRRLKEEQLKYNREYTKFRRELMITEDETRSVDNQLAYAQTQLDRLKNTNVFDATFHIWHDGHFGTINHFRLGRLPSVPVNWAEINAAWGQTALLLASLARKMELTFERYSLVPYGDHSYLEERATGKQLPLHVKGGKKFYWDTKFDAAMVAFVDCFQQFKDEVEKSGSGFCLPYKMDKGKIENTATGIAYSIKIQLNSEEQWTKALKFLLTNLKWGLAYISSQFVDE